MARIRTVKPEFWTSEQVMECSTTARLLFIGLLNFSDDGGNHQASPKTLKAEVFPGDDISAGQVAEMMVELVKNGLVIEYESAGKPYWHVTGWHHQKIEKPTYKHPAPPENHQPIDDQSPTSRRPVAEPSTPEGKGMEGNGREGVNPAPKPARFDPASMPLPPGIPPDKWAGWIAYRRHRRLSTSETTARKQLEFLTQCLARGQPPGEVIDASVRNGWQGLFELKQGNGHDRQQHLAAVAAELTGRNRTDHDPRVVEGVAVAVD